MTFYMAMLDPINTQRFPETEKRFALQAYTDDLGLGGGSVLDAFYYGAYMHEVESPGPGEVRNVLTRGIDALESGKTSVGGYYYIKNIQLKNPNPQGAFLDVQIFTTSFNDDAALKERFDNWNSTANEVKCCWDSGMGATGIKSDFTGFVRAVQYTKRNGALADVSGSWDGLVKAGERKGFGRLVNAEDRTSFIGAMDGDHATYKGLFYEDL
jgi:hypothetical protein